jgi:L-fucose mutarotase
MMGHGDEIVLADAHFPGSSTAGDHTLLIRADGIGIPPLLDAILSLIELDTYIFSPVTLMEMVEADKRKGLKAEIWETYSSIVKVRAGRTVPLSFLERFAFYERAKKAFVIVQTGETAQYGNVILKNGLVTVTPESGVGTGTSPEAPKGPSTKPRVIMLED